MKMVGSCTSSPPKKLHHQSKPRPVLTAQSNTLNVPLATLTPVHSSSPATPAAGSDDALEFPPTSPIRMSSPAHVSSPTHASSPTCASSPTSAAGHVSSSTSSNSRKHARSSAAAQSQPKTSAQPASAPPLKKAKFTDGSDKVPRVVVRPVTTRNRFPRSCFLLRATTSVKFKDRTHSLMGIAKGGWPCCHGRQYARIVARTLSCQTECYLL